MAGKKSEVPTGKVAALAQHELMMLLKLHASHIYAWADKTVPTNKTKPEIKQALLEVAARLYEVIEALPEKEAPTQ